VVCVDEFLNKRIEYLKALAMLRGKRVEVLNKLCNEGTCSKWRLAHDLNTTNYAITKALKPLVIAGLATVESETVSPKLRRYEIKVTEGGKLVCKLLENPVGLADDVLTYLHDSTFKAFIEALAKDPCGRELIAYAIACVLTDFIERKFSESESKTYKPLPITRELVHLIYSKVVELLSEAFIQVLEQIGVEIIDIYKVITRGGEGKMLTVPRLGSEEFKKEFSEACLSAYKTLNEDTRNELHKALKPIANIEVEEAIENLCNKIAVKISLNNTKPEIFLENEMWSFTEMCHEEFNKTFKRIIKLTKQLYKEGEDLE